MPFGRSLLPSPLSWQQAARFATVGVVCLVSACGSKPPPAPVKPPPPKPEKVDIPPPPPKKVDAPPPPKCEALSESCAAENGKPVRIAHATFVFDPPTGWIYAQEAEATVAQVSASGPTIVVTGYDVTDPKKPEASRDATLDALLTRTSVTPPKKHINWKKADQVFNISGLKLSVWQAEGAERAGKKGPLLVFAMPLSETKAIIGAGFVADDDTTNADDAILAAIKSLAPATATSTEPKP